MKNKSWFGRLAALVAVLAIAVAAGFPTAALATTVDGTIADAKNQNLDSTKTAANRWQVVDGEYEGNEAGNKTQFGDKPVSAQKNVVATDTENEFLIYESIDLRQRYADYFASAEYHSTTSNNFGKEDLGTVVTYMTGNEKVMVTGESGVYSNHGTFNIINSKGELVASDVTLYWSQANNVTFYLKVGGQYILVGLSVRNGATQTVMLSEEADRLIESAMLEKYVTGITVTDVMGDNIEYLGTVAGDYAKEPTYDEDRRTLTWEPTAKEDPVVDKIDTGTKTVTYTDHKNPPQVHENVTVHSYDYWARNVAELVYRVRLTPAVSTGLNESGNSLPAKSKDAAESALTNGTATVSWENAQGETESGTLPSPVVRGMHYELKLKKVDEEGNALAGATFTLYKGSDHTDANKVATVTTGENGIIDFTNLQYNWANGGSYDVVETGFPAGYVADHDPDHTTAKTTYKLCYTDRYCKNSATGEDLTGQNTPTAPNEEALCDLSASMHFANKRIKYHVQVTKVDSKDNFKTLAGATFKLEGEGVDETQTTGEDGLAAFDAVLAEGTYTITETAAPKGYQLDGTPKTLAITRENGELSVTLDGEDVTVGAVDNGICTIAFNVADRFSVPLRVKKYAADANGKADTTKALKGARFTLYTDAGCTKPATLYSDAGLSNQATELATNDNGVLTWYGLSAGDYWLKETYAPAGYKLYERAIQINVNEYGTATATMDGQTKPLSTDTDDVSYITIADPANPDMPTTGSSGRLVLTILGVGLIAGGAALVAWLRRRGGSVAAR